MSQYHPNPRRSLAIHQLHPAPRPNSSSAADGPFAADRGGLGPVYFFEKPETKWCSQWYLLRFAAPLPTRGSIMAGPARGVAGAMHTFDCMEQYMMYAKAVLFSDQTSATFVLQSINDPKECKALGRQVAHFDHKVWDQHKEEIVEEGNWWKFTNGEGTDGERIRAALLDTADREIVEASPYDRIWGIGFSAAKADASRERWGQNLLGKALVRVRQRIRDRDASARRQQELEDEQERLEQERLQELELQQEQERLQGQEKKEQLQVEPQPPIEKSEVIGLAQ